jgi:hypothetical protein
MVSERARISAARWRQCFGSCIVLDGIDAL